MSGFQRSRDPDQNAAAKENIGVTCGNAIERVGVHDTQDCYFVLPLFPAIGRAHWLHTTMLAFPLPDDWA